MTLTLILISASVFTHPEKALGEETQPITINERTYKIDGFSRSIDPTATSACTSWNTYGTCLDFTTPEPKVMTLYSASPTQWFYVRGKEFSVNQIFFTYGNTASIQVIAISPNSLSLKVTPIRESAATRDHYFLIPFSNKDYSEDTLRFGLIIPKSAIPVMSANCPKQVNLTVKGTTTFQIQTNFPADLSFYVNYDTKYTKVTGNKYLTQLAYKDLIFESDSSKKIFSITAKSTVANLMRERLFLKFNSMLDNPHPMELSPINCEIVLETQSDRTNAYSWAWGDGSKSISRKFSKENLGSAYIVIGYKEFDAKGKKLTVDQYANPTRTITLESLSNGVWEYVTKIDFTDGSNVVEQKDVNFAAELNCYRGNCSDIEKISIRSDDGVLNQLFQVKFTPSFFDFSISAPTQVIWGKTYTASVKANKPLSGTCKFSSYFRGTVDQGTSKLIGGKASRRVKFLWGEEKSTVVQLSVLCKSGPYSVDKSILIRAFRP